MLDGSINRLTRVLTAMSAASLAAMMLLTCVDVVGRATARPIVGAVEVSGFLATLALAFSLPGTHRQRGHVGVEILIMHLGDRARAVMEALTGLLGLGLFVIISWQCADYASQMRASGEVSMTLQLPTHLVIYLVAGSFGVLALVQAADVVASVRSAIRGGDAR